jgi:hypothetical protein
MSIEMEQTPTGALSMAAVHDADGNARVEGKINPSEGGRPATFSWWVNLESHEFSGELGHEAAQVMALLSDEVDRLNELAGITVPSATIEQQVKITGALWLMVRDEDGQVVVVFEAELPTGDRRARAGWAPVGGIDSLSAGTLWQMERACRDLRENIAKLNAGHFGGER